MAGGPAPPGTVVDDCLVVTVRTPAADVPVPATGELGVMDVWGMAGGGLGEEGLATLYADWARKAARKLARKGRLLDIMLGWFPFSFQDEGKIEVRTGLYGEKECQTV